MQSVHNLVTGTGYDVQQIVVATVELEKHGYSIADAWSKIETFVERARSIPSVVGVAVGSDTLLGSGGLTVRIDIRSTPAPRPGFNETQAMNAVSLDYFSTLGTRILRGRSFLAADDARAGPVAIIDERLARSEWPDRDALGQCAYIGPRAECVQIVGISEPRRSGLLTHEQKEFFVPAAQVAPYGTHNAPRTVFLRVSAPTRDVLPTIEALLRSVAPEVPKRSVRPLLDLADEGTKSWRLGAQLFGVFGVTAAIMAGIGLYAALALIVRQRAAELAVRMVLGATAGAIVGMVVRHLAVLIAAGWLFGTLLIVVMGRYVEQLLFRVKPIEPAVIAVVTLLLCAVAALGSLVPGIRAARLNPSSALRQ